MGTNKKKNANNLLLASYKDATIEQLPWIVGIKEKLETNGLLSLYLREYPNKHPFIHKKLQSRLVDQFHQNAFTSLHCEGGKLRTYATFKTNIGMERYLTEIKQVTHRTQMTKLRISDHNLLIETGRYQGLRREERLCPFCKNCVENETHFLIICPTYEGIRSNIFSEIIGENEDFTHYSAEENSRTF